jgi:hypothetical protein
MSPPWVWDLEQVIHALGGGWSGGFGRINHQASGAIISGRKENQDDAGGPLRRHDHTIDVVDHVEQLVKVILGSFPPLHFVIVLQVLIRQLKLDLRAHVRRHLHLDILVLLQHLDRVQGLGPLPCSVLPS